MQILYYQYNLSADLRQVVINGGKSKQAFLLSSGLVSIFLKNVVLNNHFRYIGLKTRAMGPGRIGSTKK
jgi:hypothetical protein